MYNCAQCAAFACRSGDLSKAPKNCPCLEEDREEILEKYFSDENQKLAYFSALVESEGYCRWTRIEEIMEFSRKCGFKNLGLAFCIGLRQEAKMVVEILTANGFTVNSVVCKNCSIPKENIKIKESEKVRPGTYEPMCNPVGQAFFLNKARTDLNIILGLCVGHDSLFIKYSKAPVTVLAVKDRILGHNPLAAVYLANGYYKDRLFPQK
ncbi:hypothetical protein AN618_01340 [Fervidicola ferrireducens]|uniref:Metal-binding protein n=1 Tax=Fervidicola ferrireducens TaxID=520764 RepID=A0A140LE21_9FIRM|nr:DUF1847 domain-containing protein [Fervidicola ferrireducens]KXG78796.1 hypothetical protein AN618_01340 [Fervidicola ferrireducens]